MTGHMEGCKKYSTCADYTVTILLLPVEKSCTYKIYGFKYSGNDFHSCHRHFKVVKTIYKVCAGFKCQKMEIEKHIVDYD